MAPRSRAGCSAAQRSRQRACQRARWATRAPRCCRWLEERGAELLLGEPIETIGAESVTLRSGRELRADVVYRCVGVLPNTGMLASSPFASAFGFRNSVVVDDHLQAPTAAHAASRALALRTAVAVTTASPSALARVPRRWTGTRASSASAT